MKIIVFYLPMLLMVCSCSRSNKKLTFYIDNSSRIIHDVNIEVAIDDSAIINEKFSYTGVVPNYTTFIKAYNKGIYRIKVNAGGTSKSDTINLDKDVYIYISYVAALQDNGDTSKSVSIYKTQTRYVHY